MTRARITRGGGRWLVPALVLLALAPSLGTLGASWIADDAAILGRVHREGAAGDWAGPQYGLTLITFWRPVTTATWALQEAWTGVSPLAPRLLNLASHIGGAVLVAGIVLRLGGARRAAFVAGALVALFPHQGGTVTWVAGRVDSLSALLLLWAAWAALGRRPVWAALPAFLGCATKEVAFVAPAWVLALLLVRGGLLREILRRAAPVTLAVAGAFLWRRLALGIWVGGYPGGTVQPALGAARASAALALASAPLLLASLLSLGVARSPWRRLALAGLVCAGASFLPLFPMLQGGVLEPQNERWLLVGEAGLALAAVAGLAGGPGPEGAGRRRAEGALLVLLLALVAWRGVQAASDTREWRAAGAEADRVVGAARAALAGAGASGRPVLFRGFPPVHGGAYCLGFGAADRFRPPFEETPRPVWPLRPLFGRAESEREMAVAPRADGSLWPWEDPARVTRLEVRDEAGAAIDALPVDERVLLAAEDRSPALLVSGVPSGATLELVAYTEMGYEPAPLGPAETQGGRRVSLMQALAASNGVATIGQTLVQAADVGARRAYLEVRAVDGEGRLGAASGWIELTWAAELVRAVR